MIREISNLETRLFAYAETWVLQSDDPDRIIEQEQPWKIFVREESEPYGDLILDEYPIGTLIQYRAFRKEGWIIVDEFMQLLFDQMIKEGFEFHPYKGKAIQVSPKELVIEYQKTKSLSSEDIAHFDIDEQIKDSECEELLPKRQFTRNKWKQVYQIITIMREEYKESFLDKEAADPKLKILEIQQRILRELDLSRGERTIYRIMKAGDKGCFD